MENLIQQIKRKPESVQFDEVIAHIDAHYQFTPTQFTNGGITNEAGQNNGSCKIFAFGKLENLTKAQTLHCFGNYYRADVLENPEGTDHANIRNFIQNGWEGINFKSHALKSK